MIKNTRIDVDRLFKRFVKEMGDKYPFLPTDLYRILELSGGDWYETMLISVGIGYMAGYEAAQDTKQH